jgi:hypothetical protein
MDAPKFASEAEMDGPKAEDSELDLYAAFRIHEKLVVLRPALFTLGIWLFTSGGAICLGRREWQELARKTTKAHTLFFRDSGIFHSTTMPMHSSLPLAYSQSSVLALQPL